jgi:hypothetical protein
LTGADWVAGELVGEVVGDGVGEMVGETVGEVVGLGFPGTSQTFSAPIWVTLP